MQEPVPRSTRFSEEIRKRGEIQGGCCHEAAFRSDSADPGNFPRRHCKTVRRELMMINTLTCAQDYWVSLLHKTLVGRRVFDANVRSLNKSHVYLYCQCTKASSRYDRGAVTIFGVNLSPENVRIDLKGAKITTLHEYVLSPGFDTPNRMFAE